MYTGCMKQVGNRMSYNCGRVICGSFRHVQASGAVVVDAAQLGDDVADTNAHRQQKQSRDGQALEVFLQISFKKSASIGHLW